MDSRFSLHRLEALTDGIYAIAMTLLVLSLPLPQVQGESLEADITSHVFRFAELFGIYALSFLVLANFWVIQLKIFRYVKAINIKHIWTNLLGLLFVCLIPFTSSMLGYHNHTIAANILFHCNVFFITLFFTAQCRVLLKHPDTVHDGYDHRAISRIIRINLIMPLVSLAGVLLSFLWADWSSLVYLAVPFLTSRMKTGGLPLRRKREPVLMAELNKDSLEG